MYFPPWQSTQSELPVLSWNLPARQSVHATCPRLGVNDPMEHSLQPVARVVAMYCPAAHSSQSLDSNCDWDLPVSQPMQTCRPVTFAYEPGVQKEQASCDWEAVARPSSHLSQAVWPLLASGRVAPVMDSEFALEDAVKAHARMETSEHIGKIVLKVGG